ncbi:hypothetical protein BDV23DRAFT_173765 [Aspergillus alliaceus]|uniref:Uncharacterized protein n=1 Tax=Petromyces alliaceus TaxID=209559 RepID=A0A5N7C3D5_PETAA|nr:hypothetical protein BDV23DRAFT_173765 [Aspergillus alliaceus]
MQRPLQPAPQRPIYAIAHKVLTPDAVQMALSHGANAVRVDISPWYSGWWTDHDGSFMSDGRQACSIEALWDLAREILQPAGVRVLYGFGQPTMTRGYTVIRDSLNENEAVVISGRTHDVLERYKAAGESIPIDRRVMDYGRYPMVRRLLDEAAIDGFVYGHSDADYGDDDGTRVAIRDIVGFVDSHSDSHRMATRYDSPW